jgi:hypothetical protein
MQSRRACIFAIKNVSFDRYGAKLIVRGKTGMRRIRIIASTPYLSTWMNNHPRRSDPEATLWIAVGTRHHDKLMSYPAIHSLLYKLGRKAGIKKES